jgi:hypothetical protein
VGKQARVALFGEQRRNIVVEDGATEGAVVGGNLVWSDGTVVTEADIRNVTTTTTNISGTTWTGNTIWSLISNVPAIIKSLAALTTNGWLRNDSSVISALHWPYIKTSIETGESLTIPADSQAIVFDEFTFDGGEIVIDGELVLLGGDEVDVHPIVSKTTTYAATVADEYILCDASGGAFTVTLPTAVGINGKAFSIKKTDSSGNAVTVDADGTETIDGALTKLISAPYDTMKIISDNANWHIV